MSLWKIELRTEPVEVEDFMPAPVAKIVATEVNMPFGEDRMAELSPQLMSISEVEYQVGRLRKQLDQIERGAREYFKTSRSAIARRKGKP